MSQTETTIFVQEQERWIKQRGGNLEGYYRHFGNRTPPEEVRRFYANDLEELAMYVRQMGEKELT